MVAHVLIDLHRRQATLPVPTAAGITGDTTAAAASPTGSGLAFDTAASSGSADRTPPPLGLTSTPVVTQSFTQTSSQAPAASSSGATTSASAGGSPIPIGTVIGACVGAFAGAVFLICVGLWFYKRSSQALKARARAPLSPLAATRNARGEHERSRSRHTWNKLEEGDDKWEGMYQTKEVDSNNVAPMEKLTMFKKSPSLRTTATGFTTKSEELPTFDLTPHPFAQYHPRLAEELAADPPKHPQQQQPFLGQVDAGPALSWTPDPDGSYLSLRSADMSTARSMSPTVNMARPTPPATSSAPHRWETAEVMHYEGESAQIVDNPFTDGTERRKSLNNPFFSAQDFDAAKSKATAKSIKGKERMHDNNPFRNADMPSVSPGDVSRHGGSDSTSSNSNSDAILSIIAVLDNPPAPATQGSRLSSVTTVSAYSNTAEVEEDVTTAFPLPPRSKS